MPRGIYPRARRHALNRSVFLTFVSSMPTARPELSFERAVGAFTSYTLRSPRGASSIGRAPPLQGGGYRFETGALHLPGRPRAKCRRHRHCSRLHTEDGGAKVHADRARSACRFYLRCAETTLGSDGDRHALRGACCSGHPALICNENRSPA